MAPDQRPESEPRDVTVHRLEFDVEWPPGQVAAYLLDEVEPILVDAGMPGEPNERALHEQLATRGCTVGDIAHVVVTHPHLDHVGLLPHLQACGDPTVYAPATSRELLERPIDDIEANIRGLVRQAGVPERLADSVVERAVDRHLRIRNCLPADAVDVWMAGGERVEIADRVFEAVYTPGHQRDHLCLETDLNGIRASFSGDMIIRPFRAAAVHANFTAEQKEAVTAYYEALDRLDGRTVDRVFPGHGPIHEEYAAAISTAREGLDRLCEATHDAVRLSGTHAIHAASARTEEFTDGPYVPEAVGALAHLERQGRLDSSVQDGVRYYIPA